MEETWDAFWSHILAYVCFPIRAASSDSQEGFKKSVCGVWIWCRSLTSSNPEYCLTSQCVDILIKEMGPFVSILQMAGKGLDDTGLWKGIKLFHTHSASISTLISFQVTAGRLTDPVASSPAMPLMLGFSTPGSRRQEHHAS